jgi:hypothetical protein
MHVMRSPDCKEKGLLRALKNLSCMQRRCPDMMHAYVVGASRKGHSQQRLDTHEWGTRPGHVADVVEGERPHAIKNTGHHGSWPMGSDHKDRYQEARACSRHRNRSWRR